MDLKATYNKIARSWFEDHKESDWWNDSATKFLNYLKPGARVLDVGCGAGLKTRYIIERGFKAVGIDLSEEMIRLAKEHHPGAEYLVRDINKSLGLGIFDGIFAQAVLLHIPKKEIVGVLKNLADHLDSKGYFYLAVKEQREGQPEEQVVTENDYGYDYSRFFSYYKTEEMERYLKEAGIETIHKSFAPHNQTNWIVMIGQKEL